MFSETQPKNGARRPSQAAPPGRSESKARDLHQIGDQSEVERFLESSQAYGISGTAVERIDTHAAMVFLAGDRAFKVKRAVKYPYLDFSTLARREEVCQHEIELNRRTAPDIYLGVCAIRRNESGQLYLERGAANDSLDPVVEWAVEMRRFDREDMLDRLVARDALSDDLLDDLARTIAAFHESAARCAQGFNTAENFIEVVHGNDLAFDEHRSLFPRAASLNLTRRSLDLIEKHAALFSAREVEGRTRHCHGDLHLANIVMLKGQPVLFDAIEFDDRIATIDVFYDLAFLLMDLWEQGCCHEANVVFNRYLAITGDYGALPLLPLFLSVRASIRAKVSAAQGRCEDAKKYFRNAVRFLEAVKPACVAVGGLSGSGKTAVSRALAPFVGSAPGAVHLRSDIIRKEVFGVAETKRLPPSCYSRQTSAQVYDVMFRRAHAVLQSGHSVIVDAVFSTPEERRAISGIAVNLALRAQCFWLTAPKAVLKRRVSERKNDASDATPDVVEQQARYDLGALSWHRVDSDVAPKELAGRILAQIVREAGTDHDIT